MDPIEELREPDPTQHFSPGAAKARLRQRALEHPKPTTSLPLGSLMDGWRTGDPRTRRWLLAAVGRLLHGLLGRGRF